MVSRSIGFYRVPGRIGSGTTGRLYGWRHPKEWHLLLSQMAAGWSRGLAYPRAIGYKPCIISDFWLAERAGRLPPQPPRWRGPSFASTDEWRRPAREQSPFPGRNPPGHTVLHGGPSGELPPGGAHGGRFPGRSARGS